MSSLNEVNLIGNLGADPDIRTFQNGGRVCNLSIATSEKWRDKNTGETREHTDWHRITIFNEGLIKVCEKWLKKGAKVYVKGQLKTRKWQDQEGKDRYSTEVVLQGFDGKMKMLGGSGGGGQNQGGANGSGQSGGGYSGGGYGSGHSDGGDLNAGQQSDLDEEIPF